MDKENQVGRIFYCLFDILKIDFYGNVFGRKETTGCSSSVTQGRTPAGRLGVLWSNEGLSVYGLCSQSLIFGLVSPSLATV